MALAHYQGYVENVSTGKALPAAVIRVYSYPGNVLQSTFADLSSTPLPTVLTDSNGAFEFYIPDGAYDLEYVFNGDVLTRLVNIAIFNPANYASGANVDAILGAAAATGHLGTFAGATIADNSTVKTALQSLETATELRPTSATLSASSGSALVGFLQDGTGAVARTVQAKERDVLHVADFLPVGYVTNGSVDYTTQMQAAINQAISSKRRLVFPNGTFAVSGTGLNITLTGPQQLVMQGQGLQNTVLYNANGNVLRASGQFLTVSDILLLSAGGGHTVLQTGLLAQTLWTQVGIAQNADGFSVWENATQEFVDNRFVACAFDHTTTSTVYGFNLTSAGGLLNDNSWLNCRVNNSGTKHFFNVETTSANAQYANKWDGITWEVCLGGGIRMRGVNGFVIENCQNWDATGIVNDFYDLDTAVGIGCIGKISNCGRWAATLAVGKFDVKLPGGGGGAGIIIENCRTVGGGDPFKIDAANNGFQLVRPSSATCSVTNAAGVTLIDPSLGNIDIPTEYRVLGTKVVGARGAALPADATDLATAITLANAIKARLKATGGHGLVAD